MAAPKGHKRWGGRKPGTPNKITADLRAALTAIAHQNIDQVQEWLLAIPDPDTRIARYLDLCEYVIPKLARTELTGKDGEVIKAAVTVVAAPLDDAL